jgi:beta-phosphoglucomutase-like phosphatase (HAD superfamily)
MNYGAITLLTCSFLTGFLDAKSVPTVDYRPSNTAIIFDVDGVILKRTVPVSSLLWRHKGELTKALLDFGLMKDVLTLFRMTAPVGAYISLFERKHPGLVPFARELATTRILKLKTVSIIKRLLSLGYELHIGTNETANEFALHQEQFPIFSRFTTYSFADYSTFPAVIQKPNPHYFEHLAHRVLAHNPKITHFIFIDDRKDNVEAACSRGFTGIIFTVPEALESTLVEMGILQPNDAANIILPMVML